MSIKEEGGAGEVGTDKLVRKYIEMTPGQTLAIIKKLISERTKKRTTRTKRIHRRKHFGDDEVEGPKADPNGAIESGVARAIKNLKKALPKGYE